MANSVMGVRAEILKEIVEELENWKKWSIVEVFDFVKYV